MIKSVSPAVRRLLAGGRLTGYRAEFAALEILRPARAARRAAELWFTPPPPVRTRSPRPPHGTDFELVVGGVPVRGTVWGSGRPVYFMHGWGGRGLQVRSLVDPLVTAGHTVITFDGPGHGPGPRVRTHAGELGAALSAVIRQHGPAEAVIAHSLGAVAVARAVVAESVDVPRLVLLAPLVDAGAHLDWFADLLRLGPRTRAGLAGEVHRQTGLTLEEFSPLALRDHLDGRDVLVAHDRSDPFTPYADTAAFVGAWDGAELISTEGPVPCRPYCSRFGGVQVRASQGRRGRAAGSGGRALGHYRLLDDPTVVAAVARFLTRAAVLRDAAQPLR